MSTFMSALLNTLMGMGTVFCVLIVISLIISLFISIYYIIISSSFIKEKIYGEFYSGISLLLTIYFISYVLVLGVKLNQVISFILIKKDKTD